MTSSTTDLLIVCVSYEQKTFSIGGLTNELVHAILSIHPVMIPLTELTTTVIGPICSQTNGVYNDNFFLSMCNITYWQNKCSVVSFNFLLIASVSISNWCL